MPRSFFYQVRVTLPVDMEGEGGFDGYLVAN